MTGHVEEAGVEEKLGKEGHSVDPTHYTLHTRENIMKFLTLAKDFTAVHPSRPLIDSVTIKKGFAPPSALLLFARTRGLNPPTRSRLPSPLSTPLSTSPPLAARA